MEDVGRDAHLEQLMSELSWLKRLATALVRDGSDADDVVQETWLVAAEHAPDDGRPLKPWLTRVALNVVRMRARTSKRRVARETAVERLSNKPSTPDELVSRVEAQRIVADAVLALAEPYRSTVLLHYFEELSSAEIARRSGTPEGTVRRRLKVGLDELRARVRAEERKTGRAVIAALAPAAVTQTAASAGRTALGVVLMKKVVAVVVIAVGLLFIGSRLYKRPAPHAAVTAQPPAGANAARSMTVTHDPALAHIVVTVADDAGPIANAIVRCAPTDGDIVLVKTASDGNVAIDVAAGEWSIAASAVGHEPAASTLVAVAGHQDTVRLVLTRGGQTLTGTVTDASGGAIAGARIDAAQLDSDANARRAVAAAFSDPDGKYKLAVGGGQIVVAASHPEYTPQTRYVDVGPSGATADFALVPGGVIEGVVRDIQTKEAVAGAEVRATNDSSALELVGATERVVKADESGKFRFAGLRPGAYELVAHQGARRTRTPIGIGLGVAEQQTDVVVLVAGTATIRGKVVDETGTAVARATVTAFADAEGGTATSDSTGAFVLEGLSPNRWALRATSDHHVADGQAIVELAKADVDDVVVHVRRGLVVKGHVEPRKLCDIELIAFVQDVPFIQPWSMATTPNGDFEFRPLAPGRATLAARCASGEQGRVETAITPDAGERVVPLTESGSIEGRVIDTRGKPIAGVIVTAEHAKEITRIENGIVASGLKAITSADGHFKITGLGGGDYRMTALDRGSPMTTMKGSKLVLEANQDLTGVELVIERPARTIRGTVTGPDGSPVSDAWVAAYQTIDDEVEALWTTDGGVRDKSRNILVQDDRTRGAEPPPTLTDARGHFELTDLGPGKFQLVAEAESGKLRARAADVMPDAQIQLQLASVSSLRGSVHGANGPTDLFSVQLMGPTSNGRSFTDGTFVFSRLDPGDYTIEVTSSDGTGKATAHVSPGEVAAVDIALVANGTVTGRLVDKNGKPISGMRVALIDDQPPGQLHIELREQPTSSGPDGRFRVNGAPGMRTLVSLGRKPTAKRGLSVQANTTVDIGDFTVDDPPK